MRIWSIQTLEAWEDMQAKGTLRAMRKHAACEDDFDDFFDRSYAWMMQQMTKRIGPAPTEDITPIWAWVFYGPKKPRPDLRRIAWHWGTRPPHFVMIEAEMPDDQVLVSHFDAFHGPLNNGYVPFDEAEDNRWDELHHTKGAITQEESDRLRLESWERIFTPEKFCIDYWGPGKPSLQGCMWELPMSAVVSTKIFRNRGYKPVA